MDTKPLRSQRNRKLNTLLLHIHPKQVPQKALKFNLTWGLGGMASLLFILLAFSGILLRFAYVPTPINAYDSVLHINNDLLFGALVRSIHYWSATLFIAVSFLHLLRVFFTGAYTHKRRSNWIIGLCLLFLLVFSNFTGYLLPWDQLSYWATTIIINMVKYLPLIGSYFYSTFLEDGIIGPNTLLFFYNLHTGLLPFSMLLLMLFHFWKVRQAGGVVIPDEPQEEKSKKLPVWPHLLVKELAVALVLIAFILLLSIIFPAPLHGRANPSISPNPIKAPWYFMGFQELLLNFEPIIAVFIIPVAVSVLFFSLPFFRNNSPQKGVWFLSKAGKKTSLQSAILSFVLAIAFVLYNEYVIKTSHFPLFIKNGMFFFILFIFFLFLLLKFQCYKFHLSKAEILQSLVVYIITSFFVFTLVGNLFRGEGMSLNFQMGF